MEANELLRVQHEVTSERDPEKRRAAIDQAYVEDLRFLDAEAEVMGRACSLPVTRRSRQGSSVPCNRWTLRCVLKVTDEIEPVTARGLVS